MGRGCTPACCPSTTACPPARRRASPSNILALQGPFTQELNEALIRQFHIRYLVTKDGGKAGGFQEKALAAVATGAQLLLIRRPEDDGLDYESVLERCREMMA